MKIICEFAKPKNEDEQVDQGERKQVRGAVLAPAAASGVAVLGL